MNKPLCVIVDDEEESIINLKLSIEKTGLLEVEQCFDDPDKFLLDLENLKSEIVFLDIEMPTKGTIVAQHLKDKYVVFVTGTKSIKAIIESSNLDQSYRTIEKPIKIYELKLAIDKVLSLLKAKVQTIQIKTLRENKRVVQTNNIAFIRSNKDKKEVVLKSKEKIETPRISLNKIKPDLPQTFVQINKSEIIDAMLIDRIYCKDEIGFELHGEKFRFTLSPKFEDDFYTIRKDLEQKT